ncbi:MAG: class I SAM-dependent methyltransferase [Burkholderiales bacterium]|nr:class I SAM-dependent methyltransferase [Burkholderiales bacterium]
MSEAGLQEWNRWLDGPAGRYLLAWEQQQYDALVDDVFGFHALQCGLSPLDCLRASRMSSRIHARTPADHDGWPGAATPGDEAPAGVTLVRVGHFGELPFGSQTLDLVILPHVLEFTESPHAVLREVDRVLRPEGRVIITGLNPVSLWGARQMLPRRALPPFLPSQSQFISPPRLRDWLELLSFEPGRAHYGCYRPPCRTQGWLDRTAFLEPAGDRWWPICGAVYALSAVKRVRAMRLVGPVRRLRPVAAPAAAASARFVPAANEPIETHDPAAPAATVSISDTIGA